MISDFGVALVMVDYHNEVKHIKQQLYHLGFLSLSLYL